MNRNQFDETTLALLDECKEMLRMKGEDYTGGDVDRLHAFKELARESNCSPFLVWRVLFTKHIQAIRSHLDGQRLLSESIHGRIVDAVNYLILLDALIIDGEKEHAADSESQTEDANEDETNPRASRIYFCESEEQYNQISVGTFVPPDHFTHFAYKQWLERVNRR